MKPLRGKKSEFGAVEKDHFNRRERKVYAKYAKLKHCIYVLCDLSESRLLSGLCGLCG
jgi:hypothetical protein